VRTVISDELGPLRAMAPRDARAAGDALAEAFLDDPLFAYVVPDAARRRPWLRTVMRTNPAMIAPSGHVYVPGDGADGALGLVPPGDHPPTVRRALPMLAQVFAASLPARIPRRAIRFGFKLVAEFERLHPREPHWYIHVVGVHPRAQSRGLGRACMDRATALADADGAALYLETGNPENVAFYERFGFEVRETVRIFTDAPTAWTMLRPPR